MAADLFGRNFKILGRLLLIGITGHKNKKHKYARHGDTISACDNYGIIAVSDYHPMILFVDFKV